MSAAPPDYGPTDFVDEFNVSRETLAQLTTYVRLLEEWQTRMNLVGPSTLADVWSRHLRDSAQLLALAPPAPSLWLDIGSGAGFPGIVVAMMSPHKVHLIEATAKKCMFLQAVADACAVENLTVINGRVEAVPAFSADVISARACAPLATLFAWGRRFATSETLWLLPKGARAAEEIAAAETTVQFAYDLHPSRTSPDARIVAARLRIGDGRRR